MKLIVIKSNVREGLVLVERAVGENQNLPILKNILIEAREGLIHLTATNLEIAVCSRVSGKVLEEGRVAVPATVLLGLINNLQTERLDLEGAGANLSLKTDNYEGAIQGLPADDFPLIPKLKNKEEYVELGGDVLREALSQTVISAHVNDLRPELGGVFLSFSIGEIRFAATDSFRLSEKTIGGSRITTNSEHAFTALIPLKTCHELLRILKDDETIRLFYDGNQMLFKTERFELISRLIDGTFPDYAAIVPKEFENEILINRQEFINAVKLAGVLSSRTSEVRLTIPANKKTLSVSSAEQGVGENTQMLPARITGEAKDICFNWRYLLDGLRNTTSEEVVMGLNQDNKPTIIKSPGDASLFYVVMPILKT